MKTKPDNNVKGSSIMEDEEIYEWRDYYDEKYFEGDGKYGYGGVSNPPYSEMGEWGKKHYMVYLSFANRYSNEYFDIFDGQGKRALDIGCAYGYGLEVVKGMGYEIYGIDISEYAIKRARDFLGDSGNIAIADAQQLPFKDSQFDLIIAFDLMEHLPYPRLMVANCYHLLKPGGLFVGSTPNKASPSYRIASLRARDSSHISEGAPWYWQKVFKKHNWQRLKVLCPQWLWSLKGWIRFNLPYLGSGVLLLAQR